ncbi:acetyl-coenzyme A synthetase, partial [Acinetobacter baumannii]|nr:acetyl-coenzyme A synthetase [Acinetobacter baumannii]
MSHPKIAEAAVVGIPHNIKGQAIYAYVTLNHGEEPTPALYAEVRNWVLQELVPLATPDVLHWTDSLPKTLSCNLLRRILLPIASCYPRTLCAPSPLAAPFVVSPLLDAHPAIPLPSSVRTASLHPLPF